MSEKNFIFEIAVKKLNLKNDVLKDVDNLLIRMTFNDQSLVIISTESGSIEFGSTFGLLAEKLASEPLQLQIFYKNDHNDIETEVGKIVCEWPENLIDELLTNENFTKHSFVEEKDIRLEDPENVGSMELGITLRTKCHISLKNRETGNLDDERGILEIFDEMNRLVDPNDVLFLIGDTVPSTKNPLEPCAAIDCHTPCLDISQYRFLHGKLVQNSDVLNEFEKLQCGTARQNITKHDCTTNSVTSQNLPFLCEKLFGTESGGILECNSVENHPFEDFNPRFKNSYQKPDASGAYQKSRNFYRKKCCPICNCNVVHLSEHGACPKCGYKQVSTAENILREWTESLADNQQVEPKIRCKCAEDGRTCPYCRVKGKIDSLKLTANGHEKLPENRLNNSSLRENKNAERLEMTPSKICKEFLRKENASCKGNPTSHLSTILEKLKTTGKIDEIYAQIQKDDKKISQRKSPGLRKHIVELKNLCEKQLGRIGSKYRSDGTVKQSFGKKTISKRVRKETKHFIHHMKKKYGKKYSYNSGRKYPRVLIGHKDCCDQPMLVPPNMGWLWNAEIDQDRRGWRPGAIRKNIKPLMEYFLKDYPLDTLSVSYKRNQKKVQSQEFENESRDLKQKPTLRVQKKNGNYLVTMNPLKDLKVLHESPDPYMKIKPIEFKIKKDSILTHRKIIKEHLKRMGFKKCSCKMPILKCCCRTNVEKDRIDCEILKICRQLKIHDMDNSLYFTDSESSGSDSELDFEFTPPVGIVKPHLLKKPNYVCQETQYNSNDYEFVKESCEILPKKRVGLMHIDKPYVELVGGKRVQNKSKAAGDGKSHRNLTGNSKYTGRSNVVTGRKNFDSGDTKTNNNNRKNPLNDMHSENLKRNSISDKRNVNDDTKIRTTERKNQINDKSLKPQRYNINKTSLKPTNVFKKRGPNLTPDTENINLNSPEAAKDNEKLSLNEDEKFKKWRELSQSSSLNLNYPKKSICYCLCPSLPHRWNGLQDIECCYYNNHIPLCCSVAHCMCPSCIVAPPYVPYEIPSCLQTMEVMNSCAIPSKSCLQFITEP